MSFQASKWVADQKTGNPSAKSVLYALANYADFNGQVFASQQRLAEDTEQSIDSVQRRLKELAARGLIYRTPQRRLEKGAGAGAWTVSFTILLMDDICIAHALAHGYDPSAAPDVAAVSAVADEGERNQAFDDRTVPQSAVRSECVGNENNGLDEAPEGHGAADCGTVESAHRTADCGSNGTALLRYGIVNSEPKKIPSNLPPTPIDPALAEGSWLAVWDRFEQRWPWTGADARHRVREKIREMSPEDRSELLPAMEAYLAHCCAKGTPVSSARGFFANNAWRDWALKAKGRKGADVGAPVFVRKGSDAWRAWLRSKGVASMPTVRRVIEGRPVEGWYFPTLFPPRLAGDDQGRAPPEAAQ
jgi:hypothetical protein